MDFSSINQIVIPQGTVSSIHRADALLWKNGALPGGYQQLAYIETTGTQYIDTGVLASDHANGLQYLFQGCITGYAQTAGNNYLFGCLYNGHRSGNISANTSPTESLLCLYIGGNSYKIWEAPLPETGADFVITLTALSSAPENLQAHMDGTPFTQNTTATPAPMPESSIYLLWCNGVGATSMPFMGRLYAFRMNDPDGTPVRNYLPCRRMSDSVVGLYDTVEDTFFENMGTGSFLAGDAV